MWILIHKAVKVYRISYTTLQERIHKSNTGGLKLERKPMFRSTIENCMAEHIKDLAKVRGGKGEQLPPKCCPAQPLASAFLVIKINEFYNAIILYHCKFKTSIMTNQ